MTALVEKAREHLGVGRAYEGPLTRGPGLALTVTWCRVVGDGTPASVRASLTRVWRLAGQPLVVMISPGRSVVDDAAVAWVDEHAVAGHRVVIRQTRMWPTAVEVPAAGPPPWCGCVTPPCPRCHLAEGRNAQRDEVTA